MLAAKGLDLRLARGGPDEHAVAAGAVDFFDHEFRQVREHVVQILVATQHPGVHIADDGRLAEIEADHLGHVGIDRFVVGDAGADGIGNGDAAGAVGGEQSGHAQHGVGPKHQRDRGSHRRCADRSHRHAADLGWCA